MRPYALFLVISICLAGCTRKQVTVTPLFTCYPAGNYAKTITDVRQKLSGVWRFKREVGGFIVNPTNPLPVSNVTLTFRADGQLVVTLDGQQKTPVGYGITIGPLPYDSANSGVRLELPSQLAYTGYSLGNSTIYVCNDELVLDYGMVVDASAQVYSRVD